MHTERKSRPLQTRARRWPDPAPNRGTGEAAEGPRATQAPSSRKCNRSRTREGIHSRRSGAGSSSHTYKEEGGNVQQPPAGRGRGGPLMRGRWRRPQGPPQIRGPPPGQAMPQYQNGFQCWGCGKIGHMQRDCPTHPWAGPQVQGPTPQVPGMGPDSMNIGLWMGPESQ